MPHKFSGGCEHVHTYSDNDPLDGHKCHCSICRGITGKESLHVVFFNYGDLKVDNPDGLKRQPYNAENPDGPLELCVCSTCGAPIMVDDKQRRIRVIAPGLMGYDASVLPDDYHAFFDSNRDVAAPADGKPVYEGLRPDFVWPTPSPA
ncbi:MAG: GFA family protein [Sinobacteraceae bacterium]|nr:GFA family protein [Nevskiaceae bacterium]